MLSIENRIAVNMLTQTPLATWKARNSEVKENAVSALQWVH